MFRNYWRSKILNVSSKSEAGGGGGGALGGWLTPPIGRYGQCTQAVFKISHKIP